MEANRKKRRGDRKDGYRVEETDIMHAFMPYLMPNRADNEAVLNTVIDLTAVNGYLEEKNAGNPEFRYTFFHVICAAIAKTILLRPKMNRFYAGHRLYDRKDIILSFVVKKKLADNAEEALAIVRIDPESPVSPLEQIYTKVRDFVYSVRRDSKTDGTTDKMGVLLHLPRPILRLVMRILRWLDYHGHYPDMLMKDDPYYSTVFISNLGSIKMDASYHHLTNWGTNSLFVTISEKKPTPFFRYDGTFDVREALELGLTIDERIADGLYYANSVKLLKYLLNHPSLLDLPVAAPVNMKEEEHDRSKDAVAR